MIKQSIKFLIKIVLLSFLLSSTGWTATYYVDSSNGNDSNPGTSTKSFATISKAVTTATPGDTIRLRPGNHKGVITITKSGEPELPITITSESSNPNEYAVIDGGATVNSSNKYGFKLRNAQWITIENLKFRNCWKEVIEIDDSNYITIRGNDFKGGRRIIYPYNSDSHHILIENNHWEQDKRIWTTWDWASLHDDYIYNGALYGTKSGDQGPGASVIRNNNIEYVFNFIWIHASALNRQANIEIYGNRVKYIRDNAVEPEERTFNLHIYHNIFNQISNGIFSIQGVAGGPIYIYGNVGYYDFTDPPYQSGSRGQPNWRVFKMSNADDSKLGDTLHTYHNTFFYGSLTMDPGKTNRNWHFYNNIGVFTNGYKLINYKFDAWDNDFDYNFSNKPWPTSITSNNQEQHGIGNGGTPGLVAPANDDFRIKGDQRLIDGGKIIQGFTQSYEGTAPDMGAFEKDKLVEGPPFYIQVPPGGLGYAEKPRITRHRINGKELRLFWSWSLRPETISEDTIIVEADGTEMVVDNVKMGQNNREVLITTNSSLNDKNISLKFDSLPIGENGEIATLWASTLISKSLTQKEEMAPFNIYQEAENMTLKSPMIKANDGSASGGAYITASQGTTSTSPVPEATFQFTIPEAGTYYLWLSMNGPDLNSDALYIGIDNTWDRVYPVSNGVYEWIKVEISHGSANYGFNLSSGNHTVRIGHGEINAKADAIYLSNDPNANPADFQTPLSAPTGLRVISDS